MSLTLAEAAPILAIPLRLCEDDPRIARYINRATERMLYEGKFKGSLVRYNINLFGGYLTLPTELETCIKAANCPGGRTFVRNQWFQFIGAGAGRSYGGSYYDIHDRGDGYCTLYDLDTTVPVSLRIYCDVLEDSDATITIMGYDQNLNAVRTNPGGVWQDGETTLLNATSPVAFQTSAFQWTNIAQIVKPRTNGNIRLYAVDNQGNQTLLGLYGPNIKNPEFRRYSCGSFARSYQNGYAPTLFTICKRRFIPVTDPNDILIVQNLAALEDMCVGIANGEDGDLSSKGGLFNSAVDLLNKQLEEHEGDSGPVDMESNMMSPVRSFL